MTWNATRTWAVGDSFTSADANAYIRDDIQYTRDTVRNFSFSRDMGPPLLQWNNGGSTSYADFGGGGTSPVKITGLVKRQSDADLLLRYYGTCFTDFTTAAGLANFAFKVGATDYLAGIFYFNNPGDHVTIAGGVRLASGTITPGTYTVILRGRTDPVHTIGLMSNGDDYMTIEALEVSLD